MKKYKVAVIGAGFIGCVHVETLRRLGNVEVVAICDPFNCEGKAAELGVEQAFADYRDMMDTLELDAVHICTPNDTHFEIAKRAIQNGIHFVCEKPFTVAVAEARELVELARERGVKGGINLHNRMYPAPFEMREMVQSGEIGDIFSIHGGYLQDWMLYDTDYSWRLSKSKMGNTRAIADIGSHWMDLVEFVVGEKIVEVNAVFRTVHSHRKKPISAVETFSSVGTELCESILVDTEDEAFLLLRLSNGIIASALISMVFAGKKNATTLQIAGAKKAVGWDSESLNELYIGYRDKANEVLTKDQALMHRETASLMSYPSGHVEGFADAFKNTFRQFYASIEASGEYHYATLEDGLHQMALCEAVYESAIAGRWVEVPDNGSGAKNVENFTMKK